MQAILELVPFVSSVSDIRSVGGGCISNAQSADVVDQTGNRRTLFVKSNDPSFLDNFQCEWDGLTRLNAPGVIGVPQPIAVGVVADQAYLITEWIAQEEPEQRFFSRLWTSARRTSSCHAW